MSRKLKLVVLGMMGRCPFGGQTWLYLNWLRAFTRLGHEVWYVEDDTAWPYDPKQNTVTDDCRYAVRHIAESLERIGMANRWAFRLADRPDACWGLSASQLDALYKNCDALLNIVGATDLRAEQMLAPFRVYVETDPVTAELRLAGGDEHTRQSYRNHHAWVTYGENYGAPDCGVPLCGLDFKKTRQPIDLDLWPMSFDIRAPHFTTIGNYRQKGSDVVYNGVTYYWSKHHEWQKFISLPQRTPQPFQLAMMPDDPADRELLISRGWKLISPFFLSLDIFGTYPDFIRSSRAEFTVAKDQNVRLRSGWFSERDVCYLASGKPVITQDTGFSAMLPTGQGLFAVQNVDQAAEAVGQINADYERHCRAARQLAVDFFDAEKVGGKFLRDLGLA